MSYEKIKEDIKNKSFAPLYFLTGDEPYHIDNLADMLEENLLDPSERPFNQTLVYGADISVGTLLDMARRFPMLSERQVIIMREAQEMKNFDQLEAYVSNPVPTTVLVLCYKYKKLDKRKSLAKNLQSKGVFFESKKLYDNEVPDWITGFVRSKSYTLEPKAAMMIAEQVGTDLSRVVMEIQKLMVNLPAGSHITVDHVDQFVGISKDFNVFELQKAIGERNIFRTNQIAYQLAANPKENPIQKIIPVLFSFFSKLLIYHSLPDKGRAAVASALGINPYFVSDYQKAAQAYSENKSGSVISILRDYDLKSKGVNSDSTEDTELTREMIYKILHV